MIPKFRAWDKETKTMNGMAEIYRNRNQEIELHPRDKNIILIQSTGLFDKNGKEIFDGDIVKRYRSPFFKAEWEYQIETVVKREAYLLLEKKFGRNSATMSFGSPFTKSDLLEVVGNIYENPELLEEQAVE